MPITIFIPTIIILFILTILFLYLFWREQNSNKKNPYPDRSIRKFFKSGMTTIYLLLAVIMGLSFITILITFIR